MNRRRGAGEGGAETLEFLGVLPLAGLIMVFAGQGMVLGQEQAEAAADARTLARAAVLCPDTGSLPPLASLDAGAQGATVNVDRRADRTVTVQVELPPRSAISNVDLRRLGIPSPAAQVTMYHEPC